MTRTWPLALLFPVAAVMVAAPAAQAGSLVRPAARAALKERRAKVQRKDRRAVRRVNGRWSSLARTGAALVEFGPQEVHVAEHEVTGTTVTGHTPSQGIRFVERLVLVRGQAPQELDRRTGQYKPARETYAPMVDIVQIDAQGNRYAQGRYSVGTEEARTNGQVNYSYKQFAGLFGEVDGARASALRARSAQAKRNWMMVRRLRREISRDLEPDEEVFLGEARLSRFPGAEPVDGHRYTGRLLLVRPTTGAQRTRYNAQRRTNETFTPTSVQVVAVVRETDASGNTIQESRQVVGNTTNGMTDVAPADMMELLGSIGSAELIENANDSLGEIVRESR